MIRSGLVAVLGLGIALCGCESRGTYEEPLIRGGLLEGELPADDVPDIEPSKKSTAAPSSRQDEKLPTYYDSSWDFSSSEDRLADLSPGIRPAIESDEAGLWMVMDRSEESIKTSGNLVRDDELTEYVRALVCQIAGDYCGDIRTYVVRNPRMNAFMAPNGLMVVHTGMLLRMRNEAQLVAILGHEVGHYLRRHSLQMMRDVKAKANFLAVFNLAMMGAGGVGSIASAAAGMATVHSIYAFSRENEREADGYGMLLMAKAGYDPREVSKIWGQLLRERDADEDYDGPPVFFATHPPSEERRAALADLGERVLREMDVEPTVGRESYVSMMLPRRAAYLEDELNLRNFDRSLMLIEMLLEDNVNIAELHFFEGEIYRLRREEGDEERALERYYIALSEPGTVPPEIHRSMGLLFHRSNAPGEAVIAFKRYLEHRPDAKDRLVILDLIKRLSSS